MGVLDCIKINNYLITLEEHSVLGGLGSILSEIASTLDNIKVHKIGIQDKFSKHCGTYEYLLKEHKIDFESLKVFIDQHL